MSKKVMARGCVEGGTLRIIHERDFLTALATFKGAVTVTVTRETRTSAQNALLWVHNTTVANALGWTPEEVHEYSKAKWNLVHKTHVNKKTGELIDSSFPGSTHDMPIDDFTGFLQRYVQGWAEEGIVLMDPEQFFAEQEKQI